MLAHCVFVGDHARRRIRQAQRYANILDALAQRRFHSVDQVLALLDHLALAEAYLRSDIDVDGDLLEVMKVTSELELDPGPIERLRLWLRLVLRELAEIQIPLRDRHQLLALELA